MILLSFLLQLKKVMGSTKPSLRYDGFGRTHQTHADEAPEREALMLTFFGNM